MYHLFSGSFDEKDNFNISLSEYHDLDNEKSIEELVIYKETYESLNFVRFNFSFKINSVIENEISKQIIKTLNLISEFFKYYSNINIEIKDIKIFYYCLNSQSSTFYKIEKQEIVYILIYPIIVSFSDNIKIINILYKALNNNKIYQLPTHDEIHKNIICYTWKYKTEEFKKYNIAFYRFCTNSNSRKYDLIEVKQDDKTFKISDYLIYNVIDLDFKCEYFNLNDISVLKTFERKRELEMIYSIDKIKTYDPKELNEEMKIICNELFNEIIDYLKVINKKIIEKYKRTTDLYYITLNFDDDEEAYLLTMDICDIQNKKEETKLSINIINKVFEKYEFIIPEIIKYEQKEDDYEIRRIELMIKTLQKENKDEEIKEMKESIEKIKKNYDSDKKERKINNCFISNINTELYTRFLLCFNNLVQINEFNLKQMIKDKKINLEELKFIVQILKGYNLMFLSFGHGLFGGIKYNQKQDIKTLTDIFKFFKIILPYLNI